MKKSIIAVIFCFMMLICVPASVCNAKENVNTEIHLDYIYTRGISAALYCNGNSASCGLLFSPVESTSKLNGTLTLYDISANRAVATWSVVMSNGVRSVSKNATISKGHRYRLSFSGQVTTKGGASEHISCSTEKQN